jgi:hypothetical protein
MSVGRESLNDRVFTFQPRIVFRSEAFALARNLDTAK